MKSNKNSENYLIFIFAFIVIAILAVAVLPRLNGYDDRRNSQFFFGKVEEVNKSVLNNTVADAKIIESLFFATPYETFTEPPEVVSAIPVIPELPVPAQISKMVMENERSIIIYAQGDRFSGSVAKSIEKTLSPYGYGVYIWDISGTDIAGADEIIKENAQSSLLNLVQLANDAGVDYLIGLDIFTLSGYTTMRTVNAYYSEGYILDGVTGIDLSYNVEIGLLERFGAYDYALDAAGKREPLTYIRDMLFEDKSFRALNSTTIPACEIVIVEGGEINQEEAALIATGICEGILRSAK